MVVWTTVSNLLLDSPETGFPGVLLLQPPPLDLKVSRCPAVSSSLWTEACDKERRHHLAGETDADGEEETGFW